MVLWRDRKYFPFPAGGLDRATSFQAHPLQTSPDMLNVRAWDAGNKRFRGGQRPGTRKAYDEELGGGEPVRMMAELTITGIVGSHPFSDVDSFDRPDAQTLGEGWAAATWAEKSLKIHDNMARCHGEKYFGANVRTTELHYDPAYPYSVQVTVVQGNDAYSKKEHVHLYVRLGGTPDIGEDGVDADLYFYKSSGQYHYQGTLKVYKDGSKVSEDDFATGNIPYSGLPRVYKLSVDENDVSVVFGDITLLGSTQITAQDGVGVGFGSDRTGDAALGFEDWRLDGMDSVPLPIPVKTVQFASAGGELRVEDDDGNLQVCTEDSAIFSSGHGFPAVEIAQKLVICDYNEPHVQGTDGTIGGTGHNELTATGVSDWTTYEIEPETDVVVLSGTNGPTAGVYKIASVVAAKVTLATGAGANGTCTYRIEVAPRVYEHGNDPLLQILMAATGKGQVPVGCRLGCRWRGRLVLARGPDSHDWYMSRAFDVTDWHYGDTDAQAAVSGGSSDAGKVPDLPTALMPSTDDYLLFGCLGSIWRLTGDPLAGGDMTPVTYDTGVLDGNAWCHGPDGRIYFLGPPGLYQVNPTSGREEPLSQDRLPVELSDVDPESYEVILRWDPLHFGVCIFLTSKTGGTSIYYFYDPRLEAFFPDMQPVAHGPTAAYLQSRRSALLRTLLLGGRDGYIRCFDRSQKNDDGVAINSYADYAPQLLGPLDNREGKLTRLDAVLAEGSDPVDWQLRVGNAAEAAVNAQAVYSGKWYGRGRQNSERCRARGIAVVLRLGNPTLGETWAVETVHGTIELGGITR